MTLGPVGIAVQEPPIAGGPSPGRRRAVRWTKGRKALFGLIGAGSLAIAGTGFVGSYDAVHSLAIKKGFGWFAPVFPLGVDLGISVLLSLDLALTWVGLRFPLLRYIAWLLTAATISFNAAASWPDVLGASMHATIPLLYISVTEAVRHAIAQATAIENNEYMDTIRVSRWFLAPPSTFAIWRSMKLWEIREYSVALEHYQAKRELRQDLRTLYGWRWRSKASLAELRPLRRARIGRPVPRVDLLAGESGAAAGSVREPERLQASAFADPGAGAQPVAAPAPAVPGGSVGAAVGLTTPDSGMAEQLLAPVPPGRLQPSPHVMQPVAGREAVAPDRDSMAVAGVPPGAEDPAGAWTGEEDAGPGSLGEKKLAEAAVSGRREEPPPSAAGASGAGPRGEQLAGEADSGYDPEDDEKPDDQQDSDGAERPKVDLGVAPEGEKKRQRAERIYLAHQAAGVELTRQDLGKWAGYKGDGSGRTQYAALERKHGPIVVRQEREQLDVAWQEQQAGEGAGARSLSRA